MNEFNEKLRAWAETVAQGCMKIAKNPDYDMALAFYPFQSGVYEHPEILFILTNPNDDAPFGGGKVTADDLIGNLDNPEPNKFFTNPSWLPALAFNKIFSGEVLSPLFEKAVVTNTLYFNSVGYGSIEGKRGFAEALGFCRKMNQELIDLLQPKTIVTLGAPARDMMNSFCEEKLAEVEKAVDGSWLILQTQYKGIPVFNIHFPSMRYPSTGMYNTGENLKRKHDWFEAYYKQLR
jgi:hypothetical protein